MAEVSLKNTSIQIRLKYFGCGGDIWYFFWKGEQFSKVLPLYPFASNTFFVCISLFYFFYYHVLWTASKYLYHFLAQ